MRAVFVIFFLVIGAGLAALIGNCDCGGKACEARESKPLELNDTLEVM